MTRAILPFLAGLFALSSASIVPVTDGVVKARNAQEGSFGAPPILHPINVDAYQSATGLHVRDAMDFSRLDPAEQAHLVYGTPDKNGQMLLANMTLYAPDGKTPILSLESFEGLTKAVDCNDNDGILSVTFNNNQAYAYALKKWKYINDEANEKILLITNHQGCGPDEQRAVYTVNDVKNDDNKYLVSFSAKPANWQDVTGSFDMDFGQAVLAPGAANKLRRRNFFSKLGDAITGDADFSKSVNFDCSIGKEKQKKTLFTDLEMTNYTTLSMDCANCFMDGTLKLVGTVKVSSFSVKQLSMAMSLTGFKAALEMATEVKFTASKSNDNTKSSEKKELSLFEAAVPGAGLDIPHILTIGAVTSLTAGFDLTFETAFAFTVGMDVQMPDTGKILLDLAHLDKASATGFGGAKATPVLKVDSADVALEGSIYLAPKIALEVAVLAIGKAETAISLNLPKIDASAMLMYKPAGNACPGNKDRYGVSFGLDTHLDLVVSVTGDLKGLFSKSWTKTLYTVDLFKKTFCFPFGSAPKASSTKPAATKPAATKSVKASKPTGSAKPAGPAKSTASAKKPTGSVKSTAKPTGSVKSTVKPTGSVKPTKPTSSAKAVSSAYPAAAAAVVPEAYGDSATNIAELASASYAGGPATNTTSEDTPSTDDEPAPDSDDDEPTSDSDDEPASDSGDDPVPDPDEDPSYASGSNSTAPPPDMVTVSNSTFADYCAENNTAPAPKSNTNTNATRVIAKPIYFPGVGGSTAGTAIPVPAVISSLPSAAVPTSSAGAQYGSPAPPATTLSVAGIPSGVLPPPAVVSTPATPAPPAAAATTKAGPYRRHRRSRYAH